MSTSSELRALPILSIRPHPLNPRFDLGPLEDLAADIAAHGLLEPVVVVPGSYGKPTGECIDCAQQVRRVGAVLEEHLHDGVPCPGGSMPAGDEWYLLAGHRRYAAARMAGLEKLPAVARFDLTSRADVLMAMLRENLHRHDLSPMEEARAYEQLTFEGMTVTRIAKQTNRSPKTIERRLALTGLPEGAQRLLHKGQITLQDAEALVDLPPSASERALQVIGTRRFRETVVRERGVTDDAAIIAELHREFLDPFVRGAQKPHRSMLPAVRREIVLALSEGLPPRVVRAWRDVLGRDLGTVDPDRALIALVAVMEAPKERLLTVLGYELSELEEGA